MSQQLIYHHYVLHLYLQDFHIIGKTINNYVITHKL